MRLREYQWKTDEFAIFPKDQALAYLGLGLGSEAGEVQGELKRIFRDDGGVLTPERREKIADELADLAWYMAQLATHAGLDLEDDILDRNIAKLSSRTARGVLRGSGGQR